MTDQPKLRRWERGAPDLPIVVFGALTAIALVYLSRSMTFWQDEWGFVAFNGGPPDILRPVNEHWSTIPLILYRATFVLIGLHSHLPYAIEVIALHLLAVGAAYVLIRARLERLAATLACVPLLLLGSGSENLFWAFQTGFVGSVAFGLWALVLLERSSRRTAVGAALLLLLSLMSSGMGLFFLVVAFGRTTLDPTIRSRALAVVPPTLVYLVWYATVGHALVTTPGHLASFVSVPRFVARGIGHAVAALTGLDVVPGGELLAMGLFAIAVVATGWAILRTPRPPALAAGALLGIVAMYVVVGLVRAQLEADFATRSRYVYVAAFLLVLAVADWLPLLRERRRGSARVALSIVMAAVLVVVTTANVVALGTIRARFQANADLTRAYIQLALAHQGERWIDPASVLPGMPPLPRLIEIIDRFGSPVQDDLLPWGVHEPGPVARESALLLMMGPGFRVEPAVGTAPSMPLQVVRSDDVAAAADGACLSLTDLGSHASVTVKVPTGSRIRMTATTAAAGRAILGLGLPPSRSIDVAIPAATPLDIVVPDLGDASIWTVRLDLPYASGTVMVCRV